MNKAPLHRSSSSPVHSRATLMDLAAQPDAAGQGSPDAPRAIAALVTHHQTQATLDFLSALASQHRGDGVWMRWLLNILGNDCARGAFSLRAQLALIESIPDDALHDELLLAMAHRFQSDDDVRALITDLVHRHAHHHGPLREEAMEWLVKRFPDDVTCALLIHEARRNDDTPACRQALRLLEAKYLRHPATRILLTDLAESHTNTWARREAISLLDSCCPGNVVEALLTRLAYRQDVADIPSASLAMDLLSKRYRRKENCELFRDLARIHPQPQIRQEAIEHLAGGYRNDHTRQFMMEIIEHDPSPDVRGQALLSLVRATAFWLYRFAYAHPGPYAPNDINREAEQQMRDDFLRALRTEMPRPDKDPTATEYAVQLLADYFPDDLAHALLIETEGALSPHYLDLCRTRNQRPPRQKRPPPHRID